MNNNKIYFDYVMNEWIEDDVEFALIFTGWAL